MAHNQLGRKQKNALILPKASNNISQNKKRSRCGSDECNYVAEGGGANSLCVGAEEGE
ncbi:MAG: hypothetical protein ABI378_13250 [Chitinophagaceae bacterium]